MAEEPDRLSQLPDELLRHILHLAPCREAVSTAVLSRRWRGLWLPPTDAAAAVEIDISSRHDWPREATLRGAEEALAAAGGPVRRLSIHVGKSYWLDDIVGDVLSLPASRGVQDVRIGVGAAAAAAGGDDDGGSSSDIPDRGTGVFELSLDHVVPSAAHLQVLHITSCCTLTPPPPACTFPCLEVLQLRRCNVPLDSLQDMVAASPQLAALLLEHTFLSIAISGLRPNEILSFRCATVTTLVLVNCSFDYEGAIAIELDVPRVQHLKYRGKIGHLSLRSPLPDLRRAYLNILACDYGRDVETCESFWSFLKNFSHTKVLKLKLEWPIDYVAALERWRIRDLLVGENQRARSIKFCVEHLEIDAPYNPESNDVGVAIGNLLQCCPVVHDLRLKLSTPDRSSSGRDWITYSLQSKSQLEFQKSMDHFRHRRDKPVVPLYGDDGKFEVSDIPGLSDRWIHFNFLQFHLKRLSLKFHMDKDGPNCIGIRLLKFFIERGVALEEIYIDDGNKKLWDHMNCKISGYAANPQTFSEYQVLAKMSQAVSINQFSSSMISGQFFHAHKLEVKRTNPWSTSRSFTILPLADA